MNLARYPYNYLLTMDIYKEYISITYLDGAGVWICNYMPL